MQFKKTCLIIFSMIITCNSYAQSYLHGGVLLNHVEEKNVRLPTHLKNIHNSQTKQVSTTATADYVSGYHGNNIIVSGNVGYQIYNGSNTRQYYYVDIYMCIKETSCTHTQDTILLDSHLNAQGGGSIFTSAYIPAPGTYLDEAIIIVSGAENSTAKGVNVVQIL